MTEAEQNRLIIEHADLCEKICADYRSAHTEFEELVAEATMALVAAARQFKGLSKFSTFATEAINNHLSNLIRNGAKHSRAEAVEVDGVDGFGAVSPSAEDERSMPVWEWDAWGDSGNARAVCESWFDLLVTPQDVRDVHETIKHRADRFASAMIGFRSLERLLVKAYLNGEDFGSIARKYQMSYRTVLIKIERNLRIMRDVIAGQDRAGRRAPTSARQSPRRVELLKVAIAI
jgi:RNA polymerase sigma factor (sigma-70 family)